MTSASEWLAGFATPGVDQIGVVVRDVDQAVAQLSSVFGIGPWDMLENEHTGVVFRGQPISYKLRLAFAQAGPVQIELIQPLDGQTLYHEHLATKGEGLHHLGILVPDLEERVAALAKLGVGILQRGPIGRSGGFVYLDTAKSAGVIFELIKATPGMVKYFDSLKRLGKQ